MSLSLANRARLTKAALDNGFDVALPEVPGWLGFMGSDSSLQVWLGAIGDTTLLVAFSRQDVAWEVPGVAWLNPLPPGAVAGRSVGDFEALHQLLGRAYRLSRALPDAPLVAFEKATAGLPRGTEAERLVVQRVGQSLFRARLLDYWEGRCALTGLAVPELLRASHIRPWAECDTDAQRLDVFNGLLLVAHLDAAFDAGLMTVDDDGQVRTAEALHAEALAVLGLSVHCCLHNLTEAHRRYLDWHRRWVFRG